MHKSGIILSREAANQLSFLWSLKSLNQYCYEATDTNILYGFFFLPIIVYDTFHWLLYANEI